MVSLQAKNSAAFEQSWSVIVKMVSFSWLVRSFVMKSSAIVPNGVWKCSGGIGLCEAFGWFVLGFVLWHVAHPYMYVFMSWGKVGHQKSFSIASFVCSVLGCPAVVES
jgi:hypothetical protein